MHRAILLIVSHLAFAAAGFAAGIYALPILTAPSAPSAAEMATAAQEAEFKGIFRRDLKGSDFFHWGEGEIQIGKRFISLDGEVAPGPDYKLYLSPEYVETEADFLRLKSSMVRVGDVKTFSNFVVAVPEGIDPAAYEAVIVWCESFAEFITAAQYK